MTVRDDPCMGIQIIQVNTTSKLPWGCQTSNLHNNVWSIQCITLNWKDTKFFHVTSIFVQQKCEEFLQLENLSVLPYKIFSKFTLTVIHWIRKTLNVVRLLPKPHTFAMWPDRQCYSGSKMGLLCWVTWLLGQHGFDVIITASCWLNTLRLQFAPRGYVFNRIPVYWTEHWGSSFIQLGASHWAYSRWVYSTRPIKGGPSISPCRPTDEY